MCRRSISLLGPNLHVHRASELKKKKKTRLLPHSIIAPPCNILKLFSFQILVHSKIADQFRQILRATIDQIFPDQNGLVMVDKAPVGRNATLLSDAVSKGAKAIYGDINDKRELATAMRPVILEDVKKDADLYYQESFGPTVSLFVVENDEEAIQIANDTEYGECEKKIHLHFHLPPSPLFSFYQPNLPSPIQVSPPPSSPKISNEDCASRDKSKQEPYTLIP